MSDVLGRITGLLDSADPLKKVAATIVLGELGARDPGVVAKLGELLAGDAVFAIPAAEALGKIASPKSLPALLDALARGGDLQRAASAAVAAYGDEALPLIRQRLETAPPELKSILGQILSGVGGRASLKLALESLYGQAFDAANKVALSVRQEMRDATPKERESAANDVEKFLAAKKTQADEVSLRAALKVLGFLELPDRSEKLLEYVAKTYATPIRIEALTALRFALRHHASRKIVRRLVDLLEDKDALVVRSARDTLTTIPPGAELVEDLADIARTGGNEMAQWAVSMLAKVGNGEALKVLAEISTLREPLRARAALGILTTLEGAESLLSEALAAATDEATALMLANALTPIARKIPKKQLDQLFKAGTAAFGSSLVLAKSILDPIRVVDAGKWTAALRADAEGAVKKAPAHAQAMYEWLSRSNAATNEDRYTLAKLLLERSAKDLQPSARVHDVALQEFEKLADAGFGLSAALPKEKSVDDEALYFVAFHLTETADPDRKAVGLELLAKLVDRAGRTKIGKAAKNKIDLLTGKAKPVAVKAVVKPQKRDRKGAR